MNHATWRSGFITFGMLTAIVFVAAIVFGLFRPMTSEAHANTPSSTASPSSTPNPTSSANGCAAEFVQQTMDRKGSPKVDPDFAAKIDQALKAGDKDAYRNTVLGVSGHNGQLLATYAHQVGLINDPNAWKPYVNGNCLSTEGQQLYYKLDGAYHLEGVTFAKGEAPANGTNSGVGSDGTYGIDASQGISGDRTAIEITLPDGSKTWIMFRCGNPVFQGKPSLPHVTTDNPKPPPSAPKCQWNPNLPPDSPDCVESKNPSQDPYPQGNAPTGGGPNDNPGAGTYVPPEQMQQPPDTPRVNPDPPAPAPPAQQQPSPSNPSPAPVPTPDPAPAPSPQPSAPPPSAPVGGCTPLPGQTTC